MPPPISPDKRDAILTDIRAGEKSCRQIARDHKVSPSTVSDLAKDAGMPDAFARSQTKNATAAVVADSRARRAEISRKFLEKADQLLDRMDEQHRAFNFGGKDNTFAEEWLDRPPPAELRNLIVSAAVAFDKHLAGERHDAGGDASAVGGMLGRLLEDLTQRHGNGE